LFKEINIMSKFSSPFFKKSPLQGAYTSGAGGMVYVSNADAFQKLQDDILTGLGPKQDTCSKLLERRNNGTITQSAYEAASKDCGKKEANDSDQAEVGNEEIDTEKSKDNNFVGDYLQEQRDEAFNNNPYYTSQTRYRGLDQYNQK